MSFSFYARMAQFPLTVLNRVDEPDRGFDPRTDIAGFPNDATCLTTVHWQVQSTCGLPARAFEVELCGVPLNLEYSRVFDNALDMPPDTLTLPLIDRLWTLGCVDGLCVTAAIEGDADTLIYAIDAQGDEIPETRQSAAATAGTAFIGPGIMGLQSTAPVRLSRLRVFGIPAGADLPFVDVATVAPAIEGIAAYEDQNYLGQRYKARDALTLRVALDALARANTPPPASAVLAEELHGAPALEPADRIVRGDLGDLVRNHFDEILTDPSWSEVIDADEGLERAITPAALLHKLAAADPSIATAVGHAVTIPVQPPFSIVSSLQEIFERVEKDYQLPYPLVRIRGHHQLADGTIQTTERYAALSLPKPPPTATLSTGVRHAPERRDGPATTELLLRIVPGSAQLATFVDTEAGKEIFARDIWHRPKALLASNDPNARTEEGWPTISIGPVSLPLAAPGRASLQAYHRDVFGRWRTPVTVDCVLLPWKVQAPIWGEVSIDYGNAGGVALRADIGWDWSARTPYEIRVGLAIGESGKIAIAPADGVTLPETQAVPLRIHFNEAAQPFLDGAPDGWSVASLPNFIDAALAPGAPPAEPDDYRRYRLRLPLGPSSALFALAPRRELLIAADAWELVSGQTEDRRSAVASADTAMHDPRPPRLKGSLWRLEWASRVDAGHQARAFIDPRDLVEPGVAADHFHIWRAHESALIDFGLALSFTDPNQQTDFLASLRQTRDVVLRLAMIEGLVAPFLHKPEIRRAFIDLFEVDGSAPFFGPSEILLSGAQPGLEFVMVTAVSATDVPSDKMMLLDLRAIAIPVERARPAPLLRAFRPDATSAFARSGLVALAVGAAQNFGLGDVRFYWDDKPEVEDAGELLYEITPQTELSSATLGQFCAQASYTLSRLDVPYWRYFAVKPNPSWSAHLFAADLCTVRQSSPADGIASPRSAIESVFLLPTQGPVLTVVEASPPAPKRSFLVALGNLFPTDLPNLAPCRIQLELLNVDEAPSHAPPVLLKTLAVNPVTLRKSAGEVVISVEAGEARLRIDSDALAGKSLRIAASDPAGRTDAISISL